MSSCFPFPSKLSPMPKSLKNKTSISSRNTDMKRVDNIVKNKEEPSSYPSRSTGPSITGKGKALQRSTSVESPTKTNSKLSSEAKPAVLKKGNKVWVPEYKCYGVITVVPKDNWTKETHITVDLDGRIPHKVTVKAKDCTLSLKDSVSTGNGYPAEDHLDNVQGLKASDITLQADTGKFINDSYNLHSGPPHAGDKGKVSSEKPAGRYKPNLAIVAEQTGLKIGDKVWLPMLDSLAVIRDFHFHYSQDRSHYIDNYDVEVKLDDSSIFRDNRTYGAKTKSRTPKVWFAAVVACEKVPQEPAVGNSSLAYDAVNGKRDVLAHVDSSKHNLAPSHDVASAKNAHPVEMAEHWTDDSGRKMGTVVWLKKDHCFGTIERITCKDDDNAENGRNFVAKVRPINGGDLRSVPLEDCIVKTSAEHNKASPTSQRSYATSSKSKGDDATYIDNARYIDNGNISNYSKNKLYVSNPMESDLLEQRRAEDLDYDALALQQKYPDRTLTSQSSGDRFVNFSHASRLDGSDPYDKGYRQGRVVYYSSGDSEDRLAPTQGPCPCPDCNEFLLFAKSVDKIGESYLTDIKPVKLQYYDKNSYHGEKLEESVKGYILPPTDHRQYNGRWKGVQGDLNSCYMDASIFAMFSYLTVFDEIFTKKKSDRFPTKEEPRTSKDTEPYEAKVRRRERIRTVMLEGIANPLRKYGLVPKKAMHTLRGLLDEIGLVQGLTGDEKDPEEFLNLLLVDTFHTPPPILLSNGQSSHLFHLLAEKDEGMEFPTVQELVERTCLQEMFKFQNIPPYLILHLPRFGKEYKMYDQVMPSLKLDITDVLSGTNQVCYVCGRRATYECYGCYKERNEIPKASFCDECVDDLHQTEKRRSHKPRQLETPDTAAQGGVEDIEGARCILKLAAVLCIETSHYVTFVATDTSKNPRWLFFDSMSDREGNTNIPEVREITDLRKHLAEARDDITSVPPEIRRLVKDGYICFYSNPDAPQYSAAAAAERKSLTPDLYHADEYFGTPI